MYDVFTCDKPYFAENLLSLYFISTDSAQNLTSRI